MCQRGQHQFSPLTQRNKRRKKEKRKKQNKSEKRNSFNTPRLPPSAYRPHGYRFPRHPSRGGCAPPILYRGDCARAAFGLSIVGRGRRREGAYQRPPFAMSVFKSTPGQYTSKSSTSYKERGNTEARSSWTHSAVMQDLGGGLRDSVYGT